MRKWIGIILQFFLIVTICLLISCSKNTNEENNPIYIKADRLYENGDYTNALPLLLKYYNFNPSSSKTSYRLATIYQSNGDYIDAIFYYQKYLQLNPNTSDRALIEQWINASKENLAKKISNDTLEKSVSSKDSTEINKLKQQNAALRTYINKIDDSGKISSVSKNRAKSKEQSESTAASKQKTYTIKQGDTVLKISKKFYGSGKYGKNILDANKDVIKSPTDLKVGDKIIIPNIY